MVEPAADARASGQLSAVLVLAETIDTRDPGTGSTLSSWAGMRGRPPGRSASRSPRWSASLAGVLHDVGKIGVSDAILRKPGPLTSASGRDAKATPSSGARILAGADLADLAEWVFAHHERMDGSGYPLGLAASRSRWRRASWPWPTPTRR